MSRVARARDHGTLMDGVYRSQRHIYDATRKYFLFGRDKLIAGLRCKPDDCILELGCGTGRNLAQIARRWPEVRLFGLDISGEMLKSARAKLGDKAVLALGDATRFDAFDSFGRDQFDRVVLSFALSMIPDWKAAIAQGADALAPGGTMHVVDFGTMGGIPAVLRAALRGWLNAFHVEPRAELGEFCVSLAAQRKLQCRTNDGPLGYFRIVTLHRPVRTAK